MPAGFSTRRKNPITERSLLVINIEWARPSSRKWSKVSLSAIKCLIIYIKKIRGNFYLKKIPILHPYTIFFSEKLLQRHLLLLSFEKIKLNKFIMIFMINLTFQVSNIRCY